MWQPGTGLVRIKQTLNCAVAYVISDYSAVSLQLVRGDAEATPLSAVGK